MGWGRSMLVAEHIREGTVQSRPDRACRFVVSLFTPRRGIRAFLAYDAVPIGGIAVSVMLGTYALLSVRWSVPLLALAFCGTALVYQLDRGLELSPEDRHNRPRYRAWIRAHRGYVRGTAWLCALVGAGMLPFLQPETVGMGMGLGMLGLLHVLPVFGRRQRLKSFWRLKPLIISGAWALGGVLLPVVEAGYPLTPGVVALAAYRFIVVFVNTLLADWSDRAGDAQAGLRTVATEWPPSVLFGAARGLLGGTLAVGVAVAVGYGLPLLLVDLLGVVGMLVLVQRVEDGGARVRRFAVDAVVAWPLVTALVAAIVGGW